MNPDGTQKWQYVLNSSHLGPPVAGSDGSVTVLVERSIISLNSNGIKKWDIDLTGINIMDELSGLAISEEGTIYFTLLEMVLSGPDSTFLYAYGPDGTHYWKVKLGELYPITKPSIGPDGTIYAASNYLYVFNSDGTKKWESKIGVYSSENQKIYIEKHIYVQKLSQFYVLI